MGAKQIRAMNQGDVRDVARLHGRLLPGLLTDLGPTLIHFFYSAALEISGTRAWIAKDTDYGVIGLCFASDQGADVYGCTVKRYPFRAFVALLAGLFMRPGSFFKTVWWFAKDRPHGSEFAGAELIYLAVEPAGKGGGVAALLVKEASDSFRARGIREFQLSVAEDNQPVQSFFESLGAVAVGTYEEVGIRRKRFTFRYEN